MGAYALTGANGSFTMTGDYSCATGQQLYLYALGGNPGSGANSSSGLLSAIGRCPTAGTSISATVNEVTTVATAYGLSGFATDATHISSSGTALAQTGVANAFATAAMLANMTTAPVSISPYTGGSPVATPGGAAFTLTPTGTASVPQTNINVIANILASCVNSQSNCTPLFSVATADSTATGTKPTDTATAAINIAHYPTANYTALTALAGSSPVFTPIAPIFFTGSPSQLSLPIVYPWTTTFGGSVAIDGAGNAWSSGGPPDGLLTELSSTGALLSPYPTGFEGYSIRDPVGVAIDGSGDAWIANLFPDIGIGEVSSAGTVSPYGFPPGVVSEFVGIAIDGFGNVWAASNSGSVTKISSTGTLLSPSPGFTGGGLNESQWIAIDSSGNAWVTNPTNNTVTELSNSGSFLSPANGFTAAGLANPLGIAIDASGTAWVVNAKSADIVEITGSGSVSTVPVSGLTTAYNIAIDGAGTGWIAATTSLLKVTKSGTVLATFAGSSSTASFGGITVTAPNIAGTSVAIDGSGNAWTVGAYYGPLVEWVGVATPVVTPLATGVKNNTLATRP